MNSYKALYRKFRPRIFDEIKGQEHIITTLQNILNLNKLSHAYLFSGPRGTGKTSVAKIFAATLNCEHSKKPSDICENCIKNMDNNLDIIEIDAASNNGIEEIRDLREKVKYSPSEYKYKVYIIDEVHMLTKGAFNALLKTLEEPPAHVIFILATTDPQKIPLTVISRLQRFNFKRITIPILVNQLKNILEKEKIQIDENALKLIAKMSEGGLRDALSIADQMSIYSKNNINEKAIREVFSLSSKNDQINLLNFAYKNKIEDLLKLINLLIENGIDIERLIINLLDLLRDFIVYNKTHAEFLLESISLQEIKKLDIDLEFAYLAKNILLPLLNELKFNEIPSRNFEMAMLELAYNSNYDTELNHNDENSKDSNSNPKIEWNKFFDEDEENRTEVLNLEDIENEIINDPIGKKILEELNEENNKTKSESQNLNNVNNKNFEKQETIVSKDDEVSENIFTTDELLNKVTQTINLQNEILSNNSQIDEAVLSTGEINTKESIIDTGEIDLNSGSTKNKDYITSNLNLEDILKAGIQTTSVSLSKDGNTDVEEIEIPFSFSNNDNIDKEKKNKEKKEEVNDFSSEDFSNPFKKEDHLFESFDQNGQNNQNPLIENTDILNDKTLTEILNVDKNEIKENDSNEDIQPFTLFENDIKNETLNDYFSNKLKPKEVLNLFLQVDTDLFSKIKEIWKTVSTYKNHEKFGQYSLYLENSHVVAAGENFILVSAENDDLIFKLNNFAKDNDFNLFLEKLSQGPKHFFGVTKETFKEAKAMWKNMNETNKEFEVIKIEPLKSFDNSKKEVEDFAKSIFGDTLEVKK